MFISSKEASVPKDIAQEIGLHYRSVEIHIENIRKALNVRKTIEILEATCNFEDHFSSNIILTSKGAEVFHLLRQGLTVGEAANLLGVSISAIKRHKETMLLVNECTTMLELVSKYYGKRILQD